MTAASVLNAKSQVWIHTVPSCSAWLCHWFSLSNFWESSFAYHFSTASWSVSYTLKMISSLRNWCLTSMAGAWYFPWAMMRAHNANAYILAPVCDNLGSIGILISAPWYYAAGIMHSSGIGCFGYRIRLKSWRPLASNSAVMELFSAPSRATA